MPQVSNKIMIELQRCGNQAASICQARAEGRRVDREYAKKASDDWDKAKDSLAAYYGRKSSTEEAKNV